MNKFLQKILDAQQVGFAVLDAQLRIETSSEIFARWAFPLRTPEAGRPRQRLDEFYPELFGCDEALLALFDHPEAAFELPGVNRELASGELCFLDLKVCALPEPNAAQRQLLFMVTDKTEPHRLQQQLMQQRHESLLLNAVFGARQQFLSNSILGSSPPIVRLKELVRKISQVAGSTILLQGESGTGKSHVARVIHYLSFEPGAPFVEVNCAAIPENLLEAELFGYEKGAFTNAIKSKKGLIEDANGGTLFLDEIGEMPLGLQAKLLNFLETRRFRRLGSNQEQSVQIRCITATNKDLKQQVEEGKFREDLYYRINVVNLALPPLRELGDDVLAFAQNFIGIYNLDFKKKITGLTAEARRLLLAYPWPGNVRELRNVIERAMIFCESPEVGAPDLSLPGMAAATPADPFQLPAEGLVLEDLEKSMLLQALQRAQGNKTRAATLLGLSRDTFRYRLEKFGIA